jgi:cell division protein FtsZ
MQLAGGAYFAVGQGSGPDKAVSAVRSALRNPMLEIGSLDHAAGILVHFTGGEDLELMEVHKAMQEIQAAGAKDAEVVFGAAIDPGMSGRVQAIVVVTGVGGQPLGSVLAGASHILLQATSVKPEEERALSLETTPASAAHAAHRVQPPSAEEDLDVPAFIRRRRRGLEEALASTSSNRLVRTGKA